MKRTSWISGTTGITRKAASRAPKASELWDEIAADYAERDRVKQKERQILMARDSGEHP